jgi:hypothetical protein
MAETIPSLWPTDFGEPPVLTPVAILRQQGIALGQQTQNIVVGRVSTGPSEGGFRQHFLLYCSPLAYETELLAVDHGIELYPATIHVTGSAGSPFVAADPEAFAQQLKQVFASERTKRIIGSLLAQSKQ